MPISQFSVRGFGKFYILIACVCVRVGIRSEVLSMHCNLTGKFFRMRKHSSRILRFGHGSGVVAIGGVSLQLANWM